MTKDECRIKLHIDKSNKDIYIKIKDMDERFRSVSKIIASEHGTMTIASSVAPEYNGRTLYLWGRNNENDNFEIEAHFENKENLDKWLNRLIRSIGLWAKNNNAWQGNAKGFAEIKINYKEQQIKHKKVHSMLGCDIYDISGGWMAVMHESERGIRMFGIDYKEDEYEDEEDDERVTKEGYDHPKTFKLHLPTLVMAFPGKTNPEGMTIYAIKDKFNDLNDTAYAIRLPNVGDGEWVCLGNKVLRFPKLYKPNTPKEIKPVIDIIHTFLARPFDAQELKNWKAGISGDEEDFFKTWEKEGIKHAFGHKKGTLKDLITRTLPRSRESLVVVKTDKIISPREQYAII